MITIVRKNLLSVTEGIILHGVNCQGVMGSGVALQIRNKYPIVYDKYISIFNKLKEENIDKRALLGTVQDVRINKDLYVFNCFTQLYYGKDNNIRYVDYEALENCLKTTIKTYNIIKLVNPNFKSAIAFPKIGAGLANGEWTIIKEIIENTLGKHSEEIQLELYDIHSS